MCCAHDIRRTALFLDFDGTLVEIAREPSAVRVAPTLAPLLVDLHRHFDGAVAIVSGRPVAEIDAFLEPARLPASGLHGMDWRPNPDAPVVRPAPDPALPQLKAELAASGLAERGLRVEDKVLSLALHVREAPELEDEVAAFARSFADRHASLSLLVGKKVFELKPAGASKADAVGRFLAEPAFADRVPVFVGDDVTDEDGMRAARERGGFGIKVGEGDSLASSRLPDVVAVHDWLAGLLTKERVEWPA